MNPGQDLNDHAEARLCGGYHSYSKVGTLRKAGVSSIVAPGQN